MAAYKVKRRQETPSRTVKNQVHLLVDQLPEGELHAARRYLEYLREMGDPILRKLLEAPPDDEPVTPEEKAAVAEAEADYRAGRVFSHEQVKRELGL